MGSSFKVLFGKRYRPLSREEELDYFDKFREGDPEAKEVLFSSIVPLVLSMAAKFSARYKLDLDDIESVALEGILHAMERFDPKKGVRFSTYAGHWVQQRMQRERFSSNLIRVPIYHIKNGNALDDKTKRTQELYEEQANAALRPKLSLSNIDDEGSNYRRNMIEPIDPAITSDDEVAEREEKQKNIQWVRNGLKLLSERHRVILEMRSRGCILQEVADELGISRERVRQIERVAKKKLECVLKQNPVRNLEEVSMNNGEIAENELIDAADPVKLLERIQKMPPEVIDQAIDQLEDSKRKFDEEYKRRKKLLLTLRKTISGHRPKKASAPKEKGLLGDKITETLKEIGGKASLNSICDEMGLTPQQVGRSLGTLVNKGIVRRLKDGSFRI